MIDRRRFLRLLAAGMVASTVDVDKLLWVPWQKTIFLPPQPTGVEIVFNGVPLTAEEFSCRYIMPAVRALVDSVDRSGLERMMRYYEQASTPGAKINVRLPSRYARGGDGCGKAQGRQEVLRG